MLWREKHYREKDDIYCTRCAYFARKNISSAEGVLTITSQPNECHIAVIPVHYSPCNYFISTEIHVGPRYTYSDIFVAQFIKSLSQPIGYRNNMSVNPRTYTNLHRFRFTYIRDIEISICSDVKCRALVLWSYNLYACGMGNIQRCHLLLFY